VSFTPHSDMSAAENQRLRDMAERFSYEWKHVPFEHARRLLLQYLPDPSDSLRPDAVTRLLLIDFRRRWQAGERLRLEDYLELFPELGGPAELPVSTIWEELRMRRSLQDSVSLEEYRRRFPRQFANLEKLVQSEAGPGDSSQPQTSIEGGGTSPEHRRQQPAVGETPAAQTFEGTMHMGGPARETPSESVVPHSPASIESAASGPSSQGPSSPGPSSPGPAASAASSSGPVDPGARTMVGQVKAPTRVIAGGGGFNLLECIGRGSYGEVWKAEAPGGVLVALKVVKWPIGHQLNQMELRSLELLKRLRHPFLVQLQAYWQEDERLFMAMELADMSLEAMDEKYRREGEEGIPIDELLVYFRESAEALDYLHGENVIHRDVKPANIMLVRGHAKIGDFGTARLRPSGTDDPRATMLGTPFYMAPEIWKQQVTPQSDQYSLAAAYVELRLHRPLFNAQNPMEAAFMHSQEAPNLEPLSVAEKKVLLQALAKDPAQRFETCAQFIQALSVAVHPPPPQPKVNQRGGWAWLALSAAPLLLLGILMTLQMTGVLPRHFLSNLIGLSHSSENGGNGERNGVPPIEIPPGFVPVEGAEERLVELDGKRYYSQIQPEGHDVKFVLVPTTRSSALRTFYIQETKVSNSQFSQFARQHPEKVTDQRWESGALTVDGNLSADEHPDLPVVFVSVEVASEFAGWLGGRLPSTAQWDKAAGLHDHPDEVEGPFDSRWTPGDSMGIAVGRAAEGPLPVGSAPYDVSQPFGCRDMAGNGLEWTRDLTSGRQVPLAEYDGEMVILRGQSYEESQPLLYQELRANPKDLATPYEVANYNIGFRVVIEL
jgi:serine/threonine protein kinase